MEKTQQIREPINSASTSINFFLPSACSKWIMTFASNADENNITSDYFRLSNIPQLKRVDMLCADTVSPVAYPLINGTQASTEVMMSSMLSLGASAENVLNWYRYFYDTANTTSDTGKNTILGVNFGSDIKPPQTKITVNMVSDSNNINQSNSWVAYVYLISLIKQL